MKIFSVGAEQKPGQRFSVSGAPSILSFEDFQFHPSLTFC